jgi:ketosteroid isomerase-like protein
MTTTAQPLLDRWADAERRGDTASIDQILTDDFVGIGPVGFVLNKQMWVGRFSAGLVYESLSFGDVSTREYGDVAVLVARQHADGRHQNGPVFAELMMSAVTVRDGDDWRIAHVQYSFIAGTPGSPI